ncbi:unnamed protein product [Vicia faba]|uniref:Uncharacterized protein n=1 Tax=Vicia faba TaxID=3906 RepID=A0AAV0ZUE4_VICFA|nr:unnamed protein product [Vicia faba]
MKNPLPLIPSPTLPICRVQQVNQDKLLEDFLPTLGVSSILVDKLILKLNHLLPLEYLTRNICYQGYMLARGSAFKGEDERKLLKLDYAMGTLRSFDRTQDHSTFDSFYQGYRWLCDRENKTRCSPTSFFSLHFT